MRGKISYHHYDECGVTTLEKSTPYGRFHAYTAPHISDQDIMNLWDGALFAEAKCDAKAIHAKAKMMHQRALGVQHAYNVLKRIEGLDQYTLEKLDRQVKIAFREADRWRDIADELDGSYDFFTKTILDRRREVRDKINKNRENPEE